MFSSSQTILSSTYTSMPNIYHFVVAVHIKESYCGSVAMRVSATTLHEGRYNNYYKVTYTVKTLV